MRVMSWNIWDVPLSPARKLRQQSVAARIAVLGAAPDGPDVLFLQEAWSPRRRAVLRRSFPHVAEAEAFARNAFNWVVGPLALCGAAVLIDSGLMTLSRHKVAAVRRHVFRSAAPLGRFWRDGEALARKSALAALIETPALGPVWAVNTHLCSFYPWQDYRDVRRGQIEELGRFVAGLTDAPVLLGGDFNVAPPGSGELPAHSHDPALWRALLEALPGFAPAPGAFQILTNTASANAWCDPREGDNTIDHIFAGPGLEASEAGRAMTEALALAPELVRPLSDHFAVTARVTRR